jgi:hypothetical protein
MDIKSIVATAIKKYFTEVAQPKSPNEQRFVDQHTIEFWPHPVAFDSQFDGTIQKDTSRDADYQPGEDAAVYDQAYGEETVKTGFAHLQELSHGTLTSYKDKATKKVKGLMKTADKALGKSKDYDSKARYAKTPARRASNIRKSYAAYDDAQSSQMKANKTLGGINRATKRLGESFTPGELKFKDGSKAVVKEADASILNKLYSSLDTVRQKDMKEHVGKSAKNYKAVLEFAIATKGK